jgi:hypothetical protein
MAAEFSATLELDSPSHERAVRVESLVERAGWLVMAAVLLLAAAGFLGAGPWSSRRVSTADGRLTIAYEAVVRYEAPCELKLVFNRQPRGDETISVAISDAWTSSTTIERIAPQPIAETGTSQGICCTFRLVNAPNGAIIYC